MVNMPVRFKRTAAAFDEAAERVRSCESSGSEHSADLCDLVNSFMEREIEERTESEEVVDADGSEIDDESERNAPEFDDSKHVLGNLFDRENDGVKKRIYAEVEKALQQVGGQGFNSSQDFKRRLMARLRNGGLDAGLCKTKWEKSGRCPTGDYEYIDVNAGESRYIIEVNLAGEFTIARPTSSYSSLLEFFPLIFVGTPEELKQVVRKMCNAIRASLKHVGILVPPWRRMAYMQAKWFGPYKRTTNEVSSRNSFGPGRTENRSVGFVPVVQQISFTCRENFGAKARVRSVGNLAAVFNRKDEIVL